MKTNPVNNEGFRCVRRGGNWNYLASFLRCTYRSRCTNNFQDNNLGTRLVRTKKDKQ